MKSVGIGIRLFAAAAVITGCAFRGASETAGGGPAAPPPAPEAVRAALQANAQKLSGSDRDFDPLMTLVGDARFVLIGEQTHGTHEFYRDRARITQRLIREKGFAGVAIEGDWPDAERVDRYVRGAAAGGDRSPEQALSGFTRRFPRWMWANAEVRDFTRWLREHNQALPAGAPRAGFYGLDVYSLGPSADAVPRALEGIDPAAARRARTRYAGFAPYRDEPDRYGLAVLAGEATGRERDVREQFEEVERLYRSAAGDPARSDALFSVLQNARVVRNAEAYHRAQYGGTASSWNVRDQHMADTLDALAAHLSARRGSPAKLVVWAHNSHVGDARWARTGSPQEWNIGQLARERHGQQTVLIGFTTYTGTVFAARAWDRPGERRDVRPALPGSFAAVFHRAGLGDFLLPLRGNRALAEALPEPRLERAIGVIYLPETERQSHYFQAHLTKQFDAVIHRDVTRALTPLAK